MHFIFSYKVICAKEIAFIPSIFVNQLVDCKTSLSRVVYQKQEHYLVTSPVFVLVPECHLFWLKKHTYTPVDNSCCGLIKYLIIFIIFKVNLTQSGCLCIFLPQGHVTYGIVPMKSHSKKSQGTIACNYGCYRDMLPLPGGCDV